MRTQVLVVALAALTCSLTAHAQQLQGSGIRYRWVDAKGLPHFSDSLSESAIKYGYDVLNNQGMVIQHVEKTLSPQERIAAQKLAAQQSAARRVAAQNERNDIQLLNTYPTAAAYEKALQQTMEGVDEQIDDTKINLHSQEQSLAQLLARAADLQNGKEPVPKFLTDRISAQRNVVSTQRATLAQQQSDRAALKQQQAQQLQHFIELKAKEKQDRGY
ncbi:DUF4124 domain-containing protein [Dyella sp. A6]|uniref:DUF4124 domain-containing protein n=1 Tax=Dyella aluminiiresistens TaxID=3069105 RepID=UPI002E76E2FE|nr:DUF4124 domain-containing protein [Dyella sp. A6]